jgi:hypothetical protein
MAAQLRYPAVMLFRPADGVRDLIHFWALVGYLAAVSLIFTGPAESNDDISRNWRPF